MYFTRLSFFYYKQELFYLMTHQNRRNLSRRDPNSEKRIMSWPYIYIYKYKDLKKNVGNLTFLYLFWFNLPNLDTQHQKCTSSDSREPKVSFWSISNPNFTFFLRIDEFLRISVKRFLLWTQKEAKVVFFVVCFGLVWFVFRKIYMDVLSYSCLANLCLTWNTV